MKKLLVGLACTALLAGCTTTASPRSAECLDARRSIQLVEVESSSSVVVRQDPSRHYRLALHQCPHLSSRATVSLANAMPQQIHRGSLPPVWASQITGSGRVCGGGFDQLVIRRVGDDLAFPPHSCRILSVDRLGKAP